LVVLLRTKPSGVQGELLALPVDSSDLRGERTGSRTRREASGDRIGVLLQLRFKTRTNHAIFSRHRIAEWALQLHRSIV
jgi:hypothetical protein